MQPKHTIDRRAFLKLSSFTSAALTIGFYFPSLAEDSSIITAETAGNLGIVLNAFISIDKTGKVSIINHRAEMGQGAFQAVPQMIAEELEVSLDQVSIAFGPGHQTKYGGSQITGGSSTVRGAYKHLLRTGATAREMLVEAAAKKWSVPATACYAQNGEVIHRPTNKKLGYGELVEEAAKLTPPKQVALKERKNYTIIGKPLPRQDTPAKVNGKAEFGLDKKLPGMLYAVVERCPYFLGKVKSYDDSAVKTMPGVKHVFKVQMPVFDSIREGVAIVADNTWTAMQARKALKVEWDATGFEHVDTATLFNRMKEDLKKPGLSQRTGGNFDATYDKAAQKLDAIYETPYEAHACMEPLNCVADVQGDKITVWGPIQGPDWIQSDLAERLKIPIDNITVNMTFLGGGFGRKAFTDYTTEAVLISKEIKAPVQVVWTREDDMTQGPFRPGAVYACKAGMDEKGRITAFQTKMAAQNMDHQWPHADKSNFNGSTTEGLPEVFINGLQHYSFSDVPTESPIPVMWWRSVYSSTNGFAYESFMDELAHAAKIDPLDFHRLQLRDERAEALMQMLEEKTGWRTREKNSGWGIAITECFKSMVGEAVKVSKQADGKLKIDRIIAVMDCGWYVNPDIIKQQVEGSIVMALGAATTHETHFTDGRAVETNFHQYHMPRIPEVPDIEVYIMENDEKPGGVGEPGLPPFAPALCNAIFDLTGKRIRKLPFNMNEV